MLNRCSSASDARHQSIELVEQSAVGRRQQFPGDGAEKWRRHERGRDQRADELPPGHVGARHQPPHWRCDRAADRRRRGCDDGGGQQRIEEIGIGEQLDEILQRQVIGLVGDAVDRKPRQRQHDQRNQARREQPQHRLGPVDFRFGGGDAGGDGHVVFNSMPYPCTRHETPSPRLRGRDERSSLLESWGEGHSPHARTRGYPPHPSRI